MTTFPRPTERIGDCLAIEGWQRNKYKLVNYEGEHWQAHRLSYNLNCEEIPRRPCPTKKGVWEHPMVLHTCNHKWCIEPKHLYLGDHKDNGKDRWRDATPEQRKAFKDRMNAITNSDGHRRKLSEATRGIPKSDEWKAKAREAHKRRPPVSEETRKKMSESAKRRRRCA